jgi:hypothetical protein
VTHPDWFIRSIVDEAMNRTPAGGFPELEKRHKLKPGTLFDWVEKYAALPPQPFSASHVWIGETTLDEAGFHTYFDHDPAYWNISDDELETASVDATGCGFSIDLGERYLYDEDLLQVVWQAVPVPVRDLLDEAAMKADAATQRIIDAAAARGIHVANAAFLYSDPTQVIRLPNRRFNGLPYLGLFAQE